MPFISQIRKKYFLPIAEQLGYFLGLWPLQQLQKKTKSLKNNRLKKVY